MTEKEKNIPDEFRELGVNLFGIIQSVWNSPERRKLTDDIELGLKEMGSSLQQGIDDLSESPTGQRMKADLDDFQERIKTGEAEEKIRSELLSALQTVNSELSHLTKQVNEANVRSQSGSESQSEQPSSDNNA